MYGEREGGGRGLRGIHTGELLRGLSRRRLYNFISLLLVLLTWERRCPWTVMPVLLRCAPIPPDGFVEGQRANWRSKNELCSCFPPVPPPSPLSSGTLPSFPDWCVCVCVFVVFFFFWSQTPFKFPDRDGMSDITARTVVVRLTVYHTLLVNHPCCCCCCCCSLCCCGCCCCCCYVSVSVSCVCVTAVCLARNTPQNKKRRETATGRVALW